MVTLERNFHFFRLMLPEFGAAFDICEEKGSQVNFGF